MAKEFRRWNRFKKRYLKIIRTPRFARWFMIGSLVILGVSVLFWSLIGAFTQADNADQLANSFLLEGAKTYSQSLWPDQHTFLLKLPLLALISLFGAVPAAFVVATVVLSLVTVGGFAYILWRIERRPLVFGTIILALAAVLLFIPAQSYPGALLPVNMAMVMTRNIEYLLFIAGLLALIKAPRLYHRSFFLVCAAFVLLFASDKLFLDLSVAASVLGFIVYKAVKNKPLQQLSLRWLVASVIGFVGAWLLLLLLNVAGALHTGSQGAAGPYGLVHSFKDFIMACIYSVLSILTNLGANPVYDNRVLKELPIQLADRLLQPATLGYLVTIAIAVIGIKAVVTILRGSLIPPKRRERETLWPIHLTLLLTLTAVAALGVYIFSNHYYPVDARYLGIVLFAVFSALAVRYRKTRFLPRRLLRFAPLLIISIICGAVFQLATFHTQMSVMADIDQRNSVVAQALKDHPVSTLLGNYWRVFPIKANAPTVTVDPLSNCTQERDILSSKAWQTDLTHHSFAYLLQIDGGLADSPACTLAQAISNYGSPNSSLLIAGTLAHPKELLLFYDSGKNFLKTQDPDSVLIDTVTPVTLDRLPFTACSKDTVMNIVAHEDDDLLFMNPDTLHSIQAGDCVRSVYVTAGDAGSNQSYWLARQHGVEAAYATMLGTPNIDWTERIVELSTAHYATIANPRTTPRISLIFLHLPDGNRSGNGFVSDRNESLQKLLKGPISKINSVDGSSSYTANELTDNLVSLMKTYNPSLIRTQSTYSGTEYIDHSDHTAVGSLARNAFSAYSSSHSGASLTYYLGYPIHSLDPNVEGDDYTSKVDAFLEFGNFDHAVCRTLSSCDDSSVYGIYLQRQYTYPY